MGRSVWIYKNNQDKFDYALFLERTKRAEEKTVTGLFLVYNRAYSKQGTITRLSKVRQSARDTKEKAVIR